jgi:hypothetical protein
LSHWLRLFSEGNLLALLLVMEKAQRWGSPHVSPHVV